MALSLIPDPRSRFALLFVIHVDEFGIHDVVFAALAALLSTRSSAGAVAAGGRATGLRGGFIHGLGQFMASCGEAVERRVDACAVVFAHCRARLRQSVLDLLRLGVADLGAVLLQCLLDVVDHGVGAVARFNGLLLLAVIGRVGLGVARHLLDFLLREAGRRGNGDLLLVVG